MPSYRYCHNATYAGEVKPFKRFLSRVSQTAKVSEKAGNLDNTLDTVGAGQMKPRKKGKGENGFTLLETLLAIAILAFLGMAFLYGLWTASKALSIAHQRETAKQIAKIEMEYIKQSDYGLSYGIDPDIVTTYGPSGYAVLDPIVESLPAPADEDIQKIRIIVTLQGTPIYMTGTAPKESTLEDYKINR